MQTPHFATTVSRLTLAIALTGTAALAFGQATTEHAAHHPEGDPSAAKTMPTKPGAIGATKGMGMNNTVKEKMDQMDGHMKTMQELHQKFMAAKTPEERNALMPEHMKAMQEGMSMMQGMSGTGDGMGMGMGMMGDMAGMKGNAMKNKRPADMAVHHQMMEQRMEMMQTMMQMMMDRLPGGTDK